MNIVPEPVFDSSAENELALALRSALGDGFHIDFNYVEKITPEKNGKYRFAICNI